MERENKELISVIIPVYNHATKLMRALESVLNQTVQNFEIIVIDDGSKEDINQACDSFNDKRIRFFRHEKHKNANVARNRGIIEAKGNYIAMLDADDEYLPEHLQRRVEMIQSCNCDGIFGSAYLFDGTKQKIKHSRPLGKSESMTDFLLTDGFCPTPSHFYKAKAAKEIKWDEHLCKNQDYDFSIRFVERFDFKCDTHPSVKIHWHKGHKKKLNDSHFSSQKLFIEKHKENISLSALVNYYRAMQKEAVVIGNRKQQEYYSKELRKVANGFMAFLLLGMVKLKSVKNRVLGSLR